jgi:hypothetical protein
MSLIAFGSVIFPETWNDYTQFAFAANVASQGRRKAAATASRGEVKFVGSSRFSEQR